MADAMALFNGVAKGDMVHFFSATNANVDDDSEITLLDTLALLLILKEATPTV